MVSKIQRSTETKGFHFGRNGFHQLLDGEASCLLDIVFLHRDPPDPWVLESCQEDECCHLIGEIVCLEADVLYSREQRKDTNHSLQLRLRKMVVVAQELIVMHKLQNGEMWCLEVLAEELKDELVVIICRKQALLVELIPDLFLFLDHESGQRVLLRHFLPCGLDQKRLLELLTAHFEEEGWHIARPILVRIRFQQLEVESVQVQSVLVDLDLPQPLFPLPFFPGLSRHLGLQQLLLADELDLLFLVSQLTDHIEHRALLGDSDLFELLS